MRALIKSTDLGYAGDIYKDAEYAMELLATARQSNDKNDAWHLVDFLHDTDLLERVIDIM